MTNWSRCVYSGDPTSAPKCATVIDFVPHEPGGTTSITVTHFGAEVGSPEYTQRDQFVMRKSLRQDRASGNLAGASAAR